MWSCNLVVQTKSGVDYLLLYEYSARGKTQIKTTCNEYRQLGYDTPGIPQKNYTNGLQATEQFWQIDTNYIQQICLHSYF